MGKGNTKADAVAVAQAAVIAATPAPWVSSDPANFAASVLADGTCNVQVTKPLSIADAGALAAWLMLNFT